MFLLERFYAVFSFLVSSAAHRINAIDFAHRATKNSLRFSYRSLFDFSSAHFVAVMMVFIIASLCVEEGVWFHMHRTGKYDTRAYPFERNWPCERTLAGVLSAFGSIDHQKRWTIAWNRWAYASRARRDNNDYSVSSVRIFATRRRMEVPQQNRNKLESASKEKKPRTKATTSTMSKKGKWKEMKWRSDKIKTR